MLGSFLVKEDVILIEADCGPARNVLVKSFADVINLTGLVYL